MRGRLRLAFTRPLALSLVAHACALVLLALLVGRLPPALPTPRPKAIEIVLAPPEPVAVTPPQPEPPPAIVKPEPPSPPPPIVKTEPPPPPPVVKQEKPPPPPRAKSKPAVVRRPPPVRQPAPYRPPVQMPLPPPPPTQTAAVPRPPPRPPPAAPVVSAAYRAALGSWLESHKHYPESARERGESGQAVLRFHVERSGQVLNYAVVRSTGYADLDAAIERMMQGARLPPFPADMSATDIEVSVTIRFALAR